MQRVHPPPRTSSAVAAAAGKPHWNQKALRLGIVLAAHAVLIYAVALSLGIVEMPLKVEPMQTMFIEDRPAVRAEPPPPVKPDLAQPDVELPIPEPVVEIPLEQEAAPPLDAAPTTDSTAIGPLESAELAVTRRSDPVYPPASRRSGEEGTVTLRVLVDERGMPRAVQVIDSSGHPRLDAAARDAIRKWRFAAALREGTATTAWTRVQVTFRLDQAS